MPRHYDNGASPRHRPLSPDGTLMEDERGSVLDEFEYVASCPEERARNEAYERALYTDMLEDVIFLRQRGFTVYLDGHDADGYPTLICDGKPITADGVRAKAARERRLIEHD